MFESERMERLVGTGQPPAAEAKVQVDRRRLEAMITGERGGESAEAFFARIERSTGATVSWPSRLKIRAKTKKDPFVKLAGTGPSVQRAAEMIGAQLGVKRERATLKMEISHCLHSQIIGRGGRNTQKIMRDTDCHIHFPDSNKLMPAVPALAQAKNDQVSISGCAKDVERARELLRAIGPLAVSVSIQLSLSRSLCAIQPRLDPAILQQKFPLQSHNGNGGNGAGGDVSVQFSQGPSQQQQQQHRLGSLQFLMRSNSRNELDMLRVFGQICQLIGVFPSGAELHCCSQFELRPTALPSLSAVRWICFRTNTQIQLNAQGLLIAGPLEGIFVARKFITGLLPVSLHFEKPARLPCLSGAAIRALERDLDVQIGEKRRRKTGKEREEDGEFTVCTYEANLFNAYLARNRLLQLGDEHPAASSVSSGSSSSGCVDSSFPQDNDQAALMRSLCRESLLADQLPLPSQLPFPTASTSPPPPFPGERSAAQELAASWKAGKIGVILGGDGAAIEGPKSPDPEESPIAAGLLAGAKSVNLQKGEFRKALDRERMQLKANQAIYNSPPLLELSSGDRQAQQQRPPTDFWSGYGFSSSLPAELLRMGRLGGLWPADREFGQQNGAAAKPRGRPIMGRGNDSSDSGDQENNGEAEKSSLPPILSSNSLPLSEPVKLAATELAASMAAGNEPKKATALVHPRVAALQAGEQKKPKFTMSTGGLFEGTLLPAPFSISEARPSQAAVGRSEPLASAAAAAAAGPSTGTGQVQQQHQPAAQQWDIRSLTEPALVLAQLGLAEHVAFFREQEIDMQAFLLLDESCLSSLGVITLGARRKIMHAVMKLRESARRHGLYSL